MLALRVWPKVIRNAYYGTDSVSLLGSRADGRTMYIRRAQPDMRRMLLHAALLAYGESMNRWPFHAHTHAVVRPCVAVSNHHGTSVKDSRGHLYFSVAVNTVDILTHIDALY